MSPLFLIALTAAAKMVRQGHLQDRELDMAGVDDDVEGDISGVDDAVDMDMRGTQDLQSKDTRSENLFGKVAAKVNRPPRFRLYYSSRRILIYVSEEPSHKGG